MTKSSKTSRKTTKNRMISMRITETQYQYLDKMAKRIKERTGFHITRASIILKMMEHGLPYLEAEFPKDRDDDQKTA